MAKDKATTSTMRGMGTMQRDEAPATGPLAGGLTQEQTAELQANADRNNAAAADNGNKAPLTPEQRAAKKRADFLRLAPRRVNNALKRINHVANLSKRAQYTFTPEEAGKIISAIVSAVERMADGFRGTEAKGGGFTL